ncbi:unnamed protein product [Caenorhabditis auriculariae]|uniref:NAD kinase 2, mitochondrial n=1 Tax=Caenorhabditis auriculariae TaxID=2777116 RepID=A0A8S1HGU6_9PELO|nr:unnamed protein product [Caenorhabditis auriculariae]
MRVRIRPHHIEHQLSALRHVLPTCEKSPTSSNFDAEVCEVPWANRMRLPRSLAAALYQNHQPIQSRPIFNMETPSFRPKRVLILTKLTRYEFEKKTNKGIDDSQLVDVLKKRGSDYNNLLEKHKVHHSYLKTLQAELKNAGVESRLVDRFAYTQQSVDWADAVFSAGGDGTFLMAASRIHSREKPVIGINTDPQGSEGYMCLIRKLPEDHLKSALQRLFSGDFQWLFRQRIRITVNGELGEVIELHDQQLNRNPATTRWTDNPRSPGETDYKSISPPLCKKSKAASSMTTVELPVLALNEVFVGESLSSRVSYYEIGINNEKMVKQKSSGITVCTGTGSTSWYFNINKLTEQCVVDLMKIISDKCKVSLPEANADTISDICTVFNQQLIFAPDCQKMAFSVRDPVFNSTFLPTDPRGFADRIRIKSRGYDAHLVVDGGVSYRFNDGSDCLMEVHEEDALRTVVFR